MRLRLVGTGSILTSHLSACTLIDDRILVDVPNGSVKAIRRCSVNPGSLRGCLISHFHADHYFDVVFLLLELGLRQVQDQDFHLAGPRGLEERVDILFKLAYPESWEKVRENSRVAFHEWPDSGGELKMDNYTIQAVPVIHSIAPAFGYLVDDGTVAAGFSGDSELCEGIHRIVAKASTAVLDASFTEPRGGHMGISDLVDLAEKYPSTRIIATHLSDQVREREWPGVRLPADGDCVSL
ncbi:MBL fold metallo-hydrolase [Amycolatopsis sp. lyj-346]|uniref:MBL fold metallo-hydrolase n=1 Tax=Amycolatopsis sp. lyj-346 TaxID=2789289 RepID=UPI00397B3545